MKPTPPPSKTPPPKPSTVHFDLYDSLIGIKRQMYYDQHRRIINREIKALIRYRASLHR
jgi:hypothetical protein